MQINVCRIIVIPYFTLCCYIFSSLIPNLLERDGLANLLVVVWVILPRRKLKKRLSYELSLTVPASSYSLIHLEYGIGHVHVGVDAFSL